MEGKESFRKRVLFGEVNRQVTQKSYSTGILTETRHYYYTDPSKWQVIEERLGTNPDAANAERQFVWGARYIDDIVLRDRDTGGNDALDERLFGLQDANWNVTAIVDSTANVQERYVYDAYGISSAMTPSFTMRASSSYEWDRTYAGYVWNALTGLYMVRSRSYVPLLGAWAQRDPVGFADGVNLYQYAGSRPLVFVDPSGTYVSLGGVCIACVISIAASCESACFNSYWDVPGESHGSCMGKCVKALATFEGGDALAGLGGGIFWGCTLTCIAWVARCGDKVFGPQVQGDPVPLPETIFVPARPVPPRFPPFPQPKI